MNWKETQFIEKRRKSQRKIRLSQTHGKAMRSASSSLVAVVDCRVVVVVIDRDINALKTWAKSGAVVVVVGRRLNWEAFVRLVAAYRAAHTEKGKKKANTQPKRQKAELRPRCDGARCAAEPEAFAGLFSNQFELDFGRRESRPRNCLSACLPAGTVSGRAENAKIPETIVKKKNSCAKRRVSAIVVWDE